MKEIQALIERAEKALKSAEILKDKEDYEASVSRSYYGMFYATEAVLFTANLKFSSHKGVISLFGEHFVKTGVFSREMGRNLSRTFEKRLLSDYDFHLTVDESDAKDTLDLAKGYIEEIASYLEGKGFLSR